MANTIAPSRSWPIRFIAVLLLVQSLGLVVLNVQSVAVAAREGLEITSWGDVIARYNQGGVRDLSPAEARVIAALTTASLLIPPVLVGLLAAVGFFFRWRWGWVLAMLTQIVILALSLMVYAEWHGSPVVYVTMAGSVLMVLYLNVYDVRTAFFARRAREAQEGLRRGAEA